ncbi:unnamed protein product [Absidia cylindrospora]
MAQQFIVRPRLMLYITPFSRSAFDCVQRDLVYLFASLSSAWVIWLLSRCNDVIVGWHPNIFLRFFGPAQRQETLHR